MTVLFIDIPAKIKEAEAIIEKLNRLSHTDPSCKELAAKVEERVRKLRALCAQHDNGRN
jgi:hypothetical protein